MLKKRDKRGENILTENLIFIILNIVFLMILVLFLFSKMGNASVLEEKYAKQIAMIIDSAKPEMEIYLDMDDAIKNAEKNSVDGNDIISVRDNVVTVKLQENSKGYSYSFFNNVEVSRIYLIDDSHMRIKIIKYKNE